MAGHAGDGVVQDDDRGVGLVIGDVGQAGHAGVHEGGVSDNRHILVLFSANLSRAVEG